MRAHKRVFVGCHKGRNGAHPDGVRLLELSEHPPPIPALGQGSAKISTIELEPVSKVSQHLGRADVDVVYEISLVDGAPKGVAGSLLIGPLGRLVRRRRVVAMGSLPMGQASLVGELRERRTPTRCLPVAVG